MDISKALRLLNVSIEWIMDKGNTCECRAELRKKYRQAMKKCHPDNNKGMEDEAKELSEAYELIIESLRQLSNINILNDKSDKRKSVLITVDQLLRIYNGENVVIDKVNNIVISEDNLIKVRLLIEIDVNIEYNGIVFKENCVVPWNLYNTYELSIRLKTREHGAIKGMCIRVGKCVKNLDMMVQSLKSTFNMDNKIKVILTIYKEVE